jgi:hypothetical protein
MQDKITAPVCTLEFTDTETSGLEATLLKWQTIRSAILSVARLKEFYCTLTDTDYDAKLHQNARVQTKTHMY